MARDSENKKSGMMGPLVVLVAIGAIGFGTGVGVRLTYDVPRTQKTAKVREAAETASMAEGGQSGTSMAAESGVQTEAGAAAELDAAETTLPEPGADNFAEFVATPIDPVVTNLGNPKNVWVRLEGFILSRADSDVAAKVLAAQAGHQILSYLRTIDVRQIEGASGLLHISEDLNEVMRTFSGGDVRQVLISGLVVE
jgi:hypothetical protein